MKRLLLLRHAKSSWNNPSLRDFDRPLNERGIKAAPLMGEFMRKQGLDPDLILVSTAERARQTAGLLIEAGNLKGEVKYEKRLYDASISLLQEIVAETPDKFNELLIIAHNPGLEELLARFTGHVQHMATASLALISFDIDSWSETLNRDGQLELFAKPKELPNYWSRT
jgi:phosphohistidine phosphatase